MTRGRWAALGAVLVLLVGALALGAGGGPASEAAPPAGRPPAVLPPPAATGTVAVPSLPPCPTALTTALAPAVLPCFDGGPDVQVSGAPGQPMLVNLWATWCAPCVDEVPLLVEVADEGRGRLGVVGVVHQDDPDSVAAFAEAFGITYPLVRDDAGDTLRTFGLAPPRTLFVDSSGRVVHQQVGEFASVEQVEALVAEHLGVVL